MAGLLNGFMIGIHLLGIVAGEPVVESDLPIDEGNGELAANLHGWLRLVPTIEPRLRPATVTGMVKENGSPAVDIEALHINMKGCQRIYKTAVSGLLINFFFCASPHVET